MRKFLLILGSLFIALVNLNAQQAEPIKVYIDEDFDAGVLPTGWTNRAISGSFDWKFGIDAAFEPGNGGLGINNIDGTKLVYFDDDSIGASVINNTPAIESATFDNSNFSE